MTECEKAGAIKRDIIVLAPRADGSGKRGLARIVDSQWQDPNEKMAKEKKFRYYITYEGENRRMDRWLGQELLS